MNQDFVSLLLDLASQWAPWVALAVARPFGFTLMFAVFYWGHLTTGAIRMAYATALALPALSFDPAAPDLAALAMPYPVALVKELALGALLGFVASAPLLVAVVAGGILDTYRGATQGSPDPSGGQAPPVATLLAVASLWLFANTGGFWVTAAMIYSSYDVWPVNAVLPAPVGGAAAVAAVVGHVVSGGLLLAAPPLLLLMASDIAHLVSSKFGKSINVTQMAFSSKALFMVIILPFFMLVAVQALRDDYKWLGTVVPMARKVFP
ncbi:hypothetical protein CSC94_14520 [Zhengella mangrovi]|uniref:EscT/YscT/HrcT family type III secretion system export apparatus protein n=1 Tax=Zhengella mangrovi TaxID=1982044 RepID=A0A2G1QLZ0_9HYPH|nr:flagellar biosynthetic protein FliR [Zhengella mangrovi]PHP66489.1 hypothetical protein CSC94_14520 [Zhengella mangrovi]